MLKFKNIIFTLFLVFVAFLLLNDASVFSTGIHKGLQITYTTLIPSLFPFMVLSSFLIHTQLYRFLSIPFYPITKYLFRLPPYLGSIPLISFIGGFPVGAKSILSLYENGDIHQDTAEKMLAFCINAGPAFIITGIGGKVLNNPTIGLILFLSQILASISVAIVMGFFLNPLLLLLPLLLLPPLLLLFLLSPRVFLLVFLLFFLFLLLLFFFLLY